MRRSRRAGQLAKGMPGWPATIVILREDAQNSARDQNNDCHPERGRGKRSPSESKDPYGRQNVSLRLCHHEQSEGSALVRNTENVGAPSFPFFRERVGSTLSHPPRPQLSSRAKRGICSRAQHRECGCPVLSLLLGKGGINARPFSVCSVFSVVNALFCRQC